MGKFFEHGGPPATQQEFVSAAQQCIEGGAYLHASVLIKKVNQLALREELQRLLERAQEKRG
jgi:hypothetical protein